MGNPDDWLATVLRCEYLPEQDIKKLCEMVNTLLINSILFLLIYAVFKG
jgi:serine/threonine-protein phosphatase PP1-1/serine/threonine-protein phosphatase 6 catalytic subunit